MDGNRFDDISKAIAGRSTRRQALRRAGSGGVLAGLASVAGIGRLRAAAQDSDVSGDTCTLQFYAETAVGPDKTVIYQGAIDLEIGSDGAIDNGVFHSDDGNDYDLVGQVTGRAVNLRITLDDTHVLALTGTAAQDALLCRGDIDGTFGGPRQRDLGIWFASLTNSNAAPTAAAQSGDITASGGDNGGSNGSGGTDNSGGDNGGSTATGPTPTPCPAIDCGTGPLVLDPDTCQCDCPKPYKKCGPMTCCFGGATCNPDGSCQCPNGTEACNEVCTPSCPAGQYFDNDCNCTAQTSCGTGETLCNGQCVSLTCEPSQLFDATSCMCIDRCSPGQGFCNGSCIDIVNDRNNCGSCGTVCQTGVPCIAGSCECPPGTTYDSTKQMCVS
jgi:hypothetical protein